MANQAIGLSHVLPNVKFVTSAADGTATALGNTKTYICVDIADLGTGFTAASGGASFTMDYNDWSGGSTNEVSYVGNADLFLQRIVDLWQAKFVAYEAAYDADQALTTPLGVDAPPSAATTSGFSGYSSATGTNIRNQITLDFEYASYGSTLGRG